MINLGQMKTILVVALSTVGFYLLFRAGGGSPGQAQVRSEKPSVQFRISTGWKDATAREWKGKLTVANGELLSAKGYRFSQGDEVSPDGAFAFRTKLGPLENQLNPKNAYGQTGWDDPDIRRLIPQGIAIGAGGSDSTEIRFESAAGNFSFRVGETHMGAPLSVLDGNGLVERMPVELALSEKGRDDDYPAIAVTPDGKRWTAWLSYLEGADQVVASGDGKLHRLTERGDHHAPAIAIEGDGSIRAVWSRNDEGTFHIYSRQYRDGKWSTSEKLTTGEGSNIWPVLVSDGAARMALVWQAFRGNQSVILGKTWDGRAWSAETRLSEGNGNCWTPAAAYGGGKLWVAYDSYATGSYQIYARQWGEAVEWVTKGENFSVRASIAVTAKGVPVVAWEESDPLWGKDFAYLFDRSGTTIYKNRRIRVAYRDGSNWKEPAAPVSSAVPARIGRYLQQPQLAVSSDGRVYLAFRVRTAAGNSRIDNWASNGRWETMLTALDGGQWTPAITMPSSTGRNSMRAAISVSKEAVHVAWPSDNRLWPGGKYGDLDIYTTSLPLTGKASELSNGRTIVAVANTVKNSNPNEMADTRRIRAYRYNVNGKRYRVLRGDLHRHTELSSDGAGDGSLDDLYRYFLDAASMDFAHVGDHQMGGDEEYNWWITQKSNDLYYMPQRLVPMYGYERSVWWPNGHRNVVWAERGKPVLKIGDKEKKGDANSGPILYPYLRQTKGIATSHSSATEQGTDWRDNDPELEPLVEIYQGFESSYETEGAPRAWKPGDATVHQGLRPLGFVWNAWAKGYKLGVQASSDHVSTHVSYACILAEDFTRAGLLDAMRKRHAYAATDNIVLDYRIATADSGEFMMGDILSTAREPKLIVKVNGTDAIKQIDVIKNNKYIHKVSPNRRDASLEYVDRSLGEGESYYYIRVEQVNGQLAWSSPIWVKKKL